MATELGITFYRSKRIDVGGLRIVKTYKKYPNKYNREIISLYLVKIDYKKQTNIETTSSKVSRWYWMNWKDFVVAAQEHEERFTKTTQIYLKNPHLLSYIENMTYRLLGIPRKKNIKDLSHTFFVYVDAEAERKGKNYYVFHSRDQLREYNDIFNIR